MEQRDAYWERRYHDAMERFGEDERHWRRIDVLLRRLIQRLLLVANGRTERVDEVIAQVRDAITGDTDEKELDDAVAALSSAIMELDPVPSPPGGNASPADPMPIGTLLTRIIDRLALVPELADQAGELRNAIEQADMGELVRQAERVASLVNRQCALLIADKVRIEALLARVAEHLTEMERYLDGHGDALQAGRHSRRELDDLVRDEVGRLHVDARDADQLESLQSQVQARLDTIGRHLHDFHGREEMRERDWEERTRRMSARIEELEQTSQELERSLKEHQKQAVTDQLTGIANRVAFEHRIEEACRRFKRSALAASLLVLDIDRFKDINDRFGHNAGDRALRIVAQQLQDELRETDFLARYGGEEFVVLLEAAGGGDALMVAEKLRTKIAGLRFQVRNGPVQITLSAGVTDLRESDTPEAAFERADRALYRAKHDGRNRTETG